MSGQTLTYMGHHWVQIQGDEITVGLTEEALDELADIKKVLLPEQGEEFEADDICGEIETSDGPLNLYVPVTGSITEVNAAVLEDPNLILEEPGEEGWLYKVEAKDMEEVADLKGSSFDN